MTAPQLLAMHINCGAILVLSVLTFMSLAWFTNLQRQYLHHLHGGINGRIYY